MLISSILLLEQEVLVMEDDFTVHILHEYPEGLDLNTREIKSNVAPSHPFRKIY